MKMRIWTEGVAGDGAAILCDGLPVPIEDLLAYLNLMEVKRIEPEDAAPSTDQSTSQ